MACLSSSAGGKAGVSTPTGLAGAPTPVGGADTPGPVTMNLNPEQVGSSAQGLLTSHIASAGGD